MDTDLAVSIEDTDIHHFGVQIDSAIVFVLFGVEIHDGSPFRRDFLVILLLLPIVSIPNPHYEGRPFIVSKAVHPTTSKLVEPSTNIGARRVTSTFAGRIAILASRFFIDNCNRKGYIL